MSTVRQNLRLTRAGIFIILAVLVALLGAAAKRSQFDGPPHRGYLSKAVKMCGARIDPNSAGDAAQHFVSPVTQGFLETTHSTVLSPQILVSVSLVSVLSPPLRV